MTSRTFTDWVIDNQKSTYENEEELQWNIALEIKIDKEMLTLKLRKSKRIAR